VSEREIYTHIRGLNNLELVQKHLRGGEKGEGTNFIHRREKGGIIVQLGWRSDYVHTCVQTSTGETHTASCIRQYL
jgi:hypothetical protein